MIALYYMAVAADGLARGIYVVCLAWATLVATDDIAAVGRVFVVAHLINVLFGPIVGTVIDTYSRRHLVMIGQAFCAGAMTLPALLSGGGDLSGIWILYAIAILVAVAGAGVGGYAVHFVGSTLTFVAAATLAFLTLTIVSRMPDARPVPRTRSVATFASQIEEGVRAILSLPGLLVLTVLLALSFSVGQLTNALLPGLPRAQSVRLGVGGRERSRHDRHACCAPRPVSLSRESVGTQTSARRQHQHDRSPFGESGSRKHRGDAEMHAARDEASDRAGEPYQRRGVVLVPGDIWYVAGGPIPTISA
jgi:hypothetical protein